MSDAAATSSPPLPLAGVVLLDLSRVLAGPLCGQILGDLGATVIKIERPGTGDETRQWGPPFSHGQSAYFQSVNRNKQSVALDLRREEARGVVDDLIRRSDLLLENFLPAEMQKFGVEPARLAQLNPRLISCSISGFGRTGPWREKPGYDVAIQALSGFMAITGPAEGAPYKTGVAITDIVTGLYAAISLLSGLVARHNTGPSAMPLNFDLALFECAIASLVNVAQSALVTGAAPPRYGNAHPTIVPYQDFEVADGHLILAVGNDAQFQRLCRLLDRPEWGTDPQFATNPSRVANREELIAALTPLFARRTRAEWERDLAAADIPHGPVQDLTTALASPPSVARGLVQEVETSAGPQRFLRAPVYLQGQPLPPPSPPPHVGEQTETVLTTLLGYDAARVDALRATGAFG